MLQLILQEADSTVIQGEILFVLLLSLAAIVAIIVERIRVPYTVALVVVGVALSFFSNPYPAILDIGSELILAILVPPLLFEATLHIKWNKLKADLRPIVLLALVGTLLSTFLVGGIVNIVLGVPIFAALAFGALISATDPVAVIAFFRRLGVSKRLSMLVEGESLFNDGVAIVLFTLALGAASAGSVDLSTSWLVEAVLEFIKVAFGGLLIGLGLGYIVSYLILKNVDDHLIETATTVALAFGAYVLAEHFHLSGILAVVAAGLMVGNVGSRNTSPTTKLTLDNFWEFLAFVANSIVFLFIGLEIQIAQLSLWPIIVAVIAVLLSRAAIVYGLLGAHGRLDPRHPVPVPYRHVMFWGGLRGAISLALALALTADDFGGGAEAAEIATALRSMTFGVVLFTLLIQGTTIEKLIEKLELAKRPFSHLELQRRLAYLHAKRTGKAELERLRDEGFLFRDVGEAMATIYDEELNEHKLKLRQHMQAYPELELEMFLQARDDVLKAERASLTDALIRGFISEEVHDELIREANERAAALSWLKENRDLGPAYIEREESE